MYGHKSEYDWLRHCPLYQNCMKSWNLILNLMYEVHNIYKFDIFVSFGVLFFLFQTHIIAFPYESTTCREISPPSINQLFVLFHLVGVLCQTDEDNINFLCGLYGELDILAQKLMKMPNFIISHSSHLKSESKFEFFRKFWYRKHSFYVIITLRRPSKGMIKIWTKLPQKWPFSYATRHLAWSPQHMCS